MARGVKLLLPGGLVLAACAVAMALPAAREALMPVAGTAATIVAAAGIPLAMAFRRDRVVLALVALWAAAWGIRLAALSGDEMLLRYVFGAAAALVPANLAVIALLGERSVASVAAVRRLALLGLEIGAVAFVWASYQTRLIALPAATFLKPALAAWTPLPHAAIVAFAAAAVVVIVRLAMRGGPVEAGLAWALVAAFTAFAGGTSPVALLGLPAAELVLVAATVQAASSLAFADSLTGLASRRTLDEDLARVPERFAVAMVDLDHFKAINDRHGHDVGDQVLRMVAGRLALVGGGGRAYRYGGEEFAILFPGRSAREVAPFVEAVRAAVADAPFVLRSPERPAKRPAKPAARPGGKPSPQPTVTVTVSAGIADREERAVSPRAVLEAADRALYRAKSTGRNRVAR